MNKRIHFQRCVFCNCQFCISSEDDFIHKVQSILGCKILSCVLILSDLVRNLYHSFLQQKIVHFAILVREMTLTELSCPKNEWCQHLTIKIFLHTKLSCSYRECSSLMLSSVQSLTDVQHFATPWTAAHQTSLSITNSWALFKLMSIELVMPSKHLILCHPLLLLPSIFPSIRVFLNESILHIRWPNYWSFSFRSVFPMTIQDWFPLGWTGLISLQSKGLSRVFSNNSKTSVLQCSAFFMIHLSHTNMTTGKTVALTIWTFVSKVISLLFNMLARFVIALLPRSSHLLTSWLQSPSAVNLEPPKK